MTYQETLTYLYNSAPLFQHVGKDAYKEGLENTHLLDAHFGHPHLQFKTIHVGGTNGKGSCSHTLAAILQTAGMKVGLFTSPHLMTFRERIRVNGEIISEEYVVSWVEKNRTFFEKLQPSFFELTTAMAFEYFRDAQVDIAIIEVGLGGRLDCTNIISPILSVITNISYDHTQFLGNTLEAIATEKAGIIKKGTPVVIGETTDVTRQVFKQHADKASAPIIFAEDSSVIINAEYQLKGAYQTKNLNTILACMLPLARALKKKGVKINNATQIIRYALANVCTITGLQGRWQHLSANPLVICDTGHNLAAWQYLAPQIKHTAQQRIAEYGIENSCLRIVFGMVDDKDIESVLNMLPREATYYFTQADTHRAIPVEKIMTMALNHGIHGKTFSNVAEAYEEAMKDAEYYDTIFIGGSTYVVADLLTHING